MLLVRDDGRHVGFMALRVIGCKKKNQKWIPRVKISKFRHITQDSAPSSFQVIAMPIFNMAAGRHLEYLKLPKHLRRVL